MPENSFDLPPLPARPQSESSPLAKSSRRSVLTLGAVAGAALLVLPRQKAQATVSLGSGNRGTLRFLAELQVLQADFFTSAALASVTEGFSEREAGAINEIAKQDSDQARWFKAARDIYGVGAFEMPSKMNLSSSKPIMKYQIPANNFTTRKDFYEEAIRIKRTAVGVFHEAVGKGGDANVVQAIAALAGTQNRHLAILNDLAGRDPFTPFVPTISFAEATRRLESYKFNPEAL